jgi:hypothetical protein
VIIGTVPPNRRMRRLRHLACDEMRRGNATVRYSVSQAAKAVGKSKATLHRAIQAGRISVVHDDATGALRVDAAELYRVFPTVPDSSHEAADPSHAMSREPARDEGRDEAVRARLVAAESVSPRCRRRRDCAMARLRISGADSTALMTNAHVCNSSSAMR